MSRNSEINLRSAPNAMLVTLAAATALVMAAGLSTPGAASYGGNFSQPHLFEQNTNNSAVTSILHRGKLRVLSGVAFPALAPAPLDIDGMSRTERANLVAQIGKQHGLPGEMFAALVMTESGFNPDARSRVGAIGFAQLMPATARELGVDPHDPLQNLAGGARYLKMQYDRFGNWSLALAAYNAGPTRVAKLGRIPRIRETQDYVRKVLARAEGFRGNV